MELKGFLREATGSWCMLLYFLVWWTKEFKAQNSSFLGFAPCQYCSQPCKASLPPTSDAVGEAGASAGLPYLLFPLRKGPELLAKSGKVKSWPMFWEETCSLPLLWRSLSGALNLVSGPHKPRCKESLKLTSFAYFIGVWGSRTPVWKQQELHHRMAQGHKTLCLWKTGNTFETEIFLF